MIYTEKFKMGLKDIGRDNKIKNKAILEMLENIAAYHSDSIKSGANENSKKGIAWVLLEWKLKVIERPVYGQELTVRTWVRNMRKFFSDRDFEIYDENNNLCVIATSKWALIDIKEGKMTRIPDEMIEKYENEEKDVFEGEKLEKIEIPTEFSKQIKYEVIRKDIDMNKHMHNLYYLDLAYETLPEEVYEKRPFNNIRITYKKEIKLGEVVTCKYSNQDNKNIIVIESSDDKTLHSIIEVY